MQSGFVNGQYISGEFIEADVDNSLHKQSDEQGDIEESEGCLSANWRVRPKRTTVIDRKKFFNQYKTGRDDKWFTGNGKLRGIASGMYKNAKVAARHLKFCPGNQCLTYLPLYNFATNMNMSDGLDVYCIECNLKKREEKRASRSSTPVDQKYQKLDNFYMYMKSRGDGMCDNTGNRIQQETLRQCQIREAEKHIKIAVGIAERRFKTTIKLTPRQILDVIFNQQQNKCEVTDNPLTLECFLDHHLLTFNIRTTTENKKVLEILCSDVYTSTSK